MVQCFSGTTYLAVKLCSLVIMSGIEVLIKFAKLLFQGFRNARQLHEFLQSLQLLQQETTIDIKVYHKLGVQMVCHSKAGQTVYDEVLHTHLYFG